MKAALVVVGCLLATGTASAQVPSDWKSRLPPRAQVAVDSLVVVGAEARLPTGRLIAKALEGAAKGVDAERIVTAVRLYLAELREASTLLRGLGDDDVPSDQDIVAVAFALHRDLPQAHIAELLRKSRGSARSAALQVAGDILARGYSADQATALVTEALARSVAERTLLDLPRAVSGEIERGATRTEAFQRVRSRLDVRSPGRPPPREP